MLHQRVKNTTDTKNAIGRRGGNLELFSTKPKSDKQK